MDKSESFRLIRTAQKESSHASGNSSDEVWQKRLAHVDMKILKEMIRSSKYGNTSYEKQTRQNCETA